MKKRTKLIIITAMVLLLGVTGYLNIMLNNSVSENSQQITTTASYFSTYRSTRESTRDQELLYYDAIISNESSTTDAIANAETLKLALISQMEQELVIEGLIKAKGFEDCIVSILDDNVNAVVKAKELNSSEVAKILAVIQSQLNASLENVTIIPVE
ncbi:MAG: SpoIIIAH-like family protein [Clostridiales bacterium]|nr:SpoIIIAH-like family protein [Clostridiales bacterium]